MRPLRPKVQIVSWYPIVSEHAKLHTIWNNSKTIGYNELQLNFLPEDATLNRHDGYLYTLLVPERARPLPISTYLFAFAAGEWQKANISVRSTGNHTT